MKKYYIMSLLFISVLVISIISPRVFTQSYRLTKVGYIDLERVIKELTSDEEFVEKLKMKLEEYKTQDAMQTNMTDTSIAQNNRDYSLRGEVKRQVANALMSIVKKEGYTLILERTEHSILYADRTFDITEPVIANVKASLQK
ncbi:OmpH family outer membrane protein [Brachyspira murdochii]|uniref:Outer membrane chaperone Skp (OmpH) n=2 Tax=Brachyspira murdochii TaxID=84378 RepID=D5UB16_BRAM5|nr:OmpH family outer membrane protein [Brachyspira murdochii]ADG71889.1 outer membrane chaperone Skp (OmpH) [Brachyspira murdochii DSM 12563]PPS22413.1 molecular chaperone Skp [Brachyspira murdochii]